MIMKETIEKFLETDLLERYLMGTTSDEENAQVALYIEKYPEVSARYDELQENLEAYSKSYAVAPPEGTRDEIIKAIAIDSANKKTPWYAIAATIAALFFAGSSFYLYSVNNQLADENALVNEEIATLRNQNTLANSRLVDAYDELARIRNPETEKYVLRGNQRAKNLKTVAYINSIEKVSLINVVDLPDLPEDQVFQMWADVDGEMVSLGVLEKAENKLLSIPYKENASSYNITIEPKGGNDHATVENLVANIAFKNNLATGTN